MKNAIFSAHLRRLFQQPALYLGILLQVVVMQIMVLSKEGVVRSVETAISFMNDVGLHLVTLLALPCIAYAMTCTEDKNTRMLYFWAIRGGTTGYAVSYFLVTMLSGFVLTFTGLGLGTALLLLQGYPISAFIPDVGQSEFWGYTALYSSGYAGRYMLCIILDAALGSMATAAVSAAAAAFFQHKVTVLVMPITINLVLGMLIPYRNFLNPDHVMYFSQIDLGGTPMNNLLLKLWGVLVYCAICGLISVRHIQKEVQNG